MAPQPHTHSATLPTTCSTPPTATPTAAHDSDLDALATAMAEQGLFGKLKIGASLLLFGEATLPDKPEHDA